MRELARPGRRPPGRTPLRGDDSGVIGVLVAAMLGCGVLLGMGMLVIDLGQIYQNGAELQNGADASALAIADSCALGGTCAQANVLPLATHYASANASGLTDHQAAVDLVCGAGSLGGCPASVGGPAHCPPAPPVGLGYVDVRTGTLTGSGSTVLPPLIGGLLGGYRGTSVGACAQAEWGSPASATAAAFTLSACSWYAYTIAGTRYASPPPYPPDPQPTALSDHAFIEHGSRGARATGCLPFQPSGSDGPGTFGWTTDLGGCSAHIGASYGGSTAHTVPTGCATALQQARADRRVVYVPVYASIGPAGAGVGYTLLGFGAFVVTGYHLDGGFTAADWLNPANNCTGDKFCIDGYFTRGLIPATGDLGGNDLGASIVRLSG